MGEIIQIHVGQAGVQIANACWELYCLEHGIKADGTLCDECPCDITFTNFFDFKTPNKVVPRAILVDSEPTVIDQVRTGAYGCLYSPLSLITGKEDSGSNFARGYYTMGAELIDITMEAIRNTAESCSNLRGFLIFRSIGGGTGSGLGNLIAEHLLELYEKIAKVEFIIFPSPSLSPLIVEPYNALLATHLGMDSMECSCILDNEALYDICSKKLNINAPKYKNLNRIIGQTASNFTTSQRFSGSSNVSFSEFQTNLVPYPRIHFPVVSYAPFIPGTGSGFTRLTTEQITMACFEPSNQLVRCNPIEGKYMTSVLLYRGYTPDSDINSSIMRLKSTGSIRFVDWSPTGFKVGTNSEPPYSVPGGGLGNTNKSLVVLSNNTSIRRTWCRLIDKYDQLYRRKAFIHHYLAEGLEEASLAEASEDICTLIYDYKEVDSAGNTGNMPTYQKSNLSKGSQGLPSPEGPRLGGSDVSQNQTRQESKSARREVPPKQSTPSNKMPNQKSYIIDKSLTNTSDDFSLSHQPSIDSHFDEDDNKEVCQKSKCNKRTNFAEPENYSRPVQCTCECYMNNIDDCPDFDCALADATSRNKSVTSIVTRIFISQRNRQQEGSNFDARGMSLPTRSDESLPGDEEPKTDSPKKSKSFESIHNQTEKSVEGSKRRSKSHEPKSSDGIQESGKEPESFIEEINTEPVRARDRFRPTTFKTQIPTRRCFECCPVGVFKLPPPRSEGQETLGEALSAKERFCNSTCQPPSSLMGNETIFSAPKDPCESQVCDDQPACSYQVDPCANQQVLTYCPPPETRNPLANCTRMMWIGPSPNAFCRQNNACDINSVAKRRKSSKRNEYKYTECFCDHDIDGGDIAITIYAQ
ncbi:tubulin alpha chain-like isoform X2 [Eupeodes corollae]|uniref:tubulin alpha chain-like isoform X2 n=1 Tax=Eupeodes corollae TaxID=290404 RepID=UPI002491D044|nr:tubulin alpha chain-like isoform X2 [Eupeodes corollae]